MVKRQNQRIVDGPVNPETWRTLLSSEGLRIYYNLMGSR
jgi:hypothetical protein